MRAVVQLVSEASVMVADQRVGAIKQGLMVLLGVSRTDTTHDADYLVKKICDLRIFPDEEQLMNKSLLDVGGSLLVVSQFTLLGDCRKGRRPSYSHAAGPGPANSLYQYFIEQAQACGIQVQAGVFQAMMQVQLINDGPVTLLLDSEKKF